MRLLFFIVLFFLITWESNAQFQGGSGDGFNVAFHSQITVNSQIAYCTGGNGDGFMNSLLNGVTLNTQALYCFGGIADGFGFSNFSGTLFSPSLFCSGGTADGFSCGRNPSPLSLNNQTAYCSGGNADGFSFSNVASLPLNTQSLYCLGGIADGFHKSDFSGNFFTSYPFCMGGAGDGFVKSDNHSSLNAQDLYCAGGSSDGFSNSALFGYALGTGIWKGTISTNWNTTGNWINSTVPNETINVVIPAGCYYYPSLTGSLSVNSTSGTSKAKNLDIQDGGSVSNTGTLSVYGTMNVSGSYVATNATSNTQEVYSGGNLIITGSGSIRLGNQSSGSGDCDLRVDNGGTLVVDGGILEVDDQINILDGATFNMTEGIVFAHKYGLGSSYSSSYPASFYVGSGAFGNISGGVVKVAGKATVSEYGAVRIFSSSFIFTGSSTLEFTDGVNVTSDEVEMKTVPGGNFNNLLINKPLRIVTIGSNAIFTGNITINPSCILKIDPGMSVIVNGDLHLLE